MQLSVFMLIRSAAASLAMRPTLRPAVECRIGKRNVAYFSIGQIMDEYSQMDESEGCTSSML
jgi:hypothetical protein